ncbi:MAG: hypothetical protein ABR508_03560 [Candidatus Baltobacteraceae bacterium]
MGFERRERRNLTGYYFPADYSAIWFHIGSDHILHVQGTLRNGDIDGGAVDQTNATYAFVAKFSAATAR